MSNLIDKSALAAEILRRKEINKYRDTNDSLFEDEAILSFLDTLEVKEVDLEKEIEFYWLKRCDLTWCKDIYSATHIREMFSNVAKHFFELGLKAQQNISIDITNIDKVIEDNGVDPNSKEAKMFKESYYMALEKLRAQKGE